MSGIISLLAALYFCCFSMTQLEEQQETPEYKYYSSQLCIGDMLSFGDKAIQFKKVVNDSRCPKGVSCIRAGNVKVLIEFFEDGKSLGTTVITGHDFALSEKLNGMEINLSGFEVTPYPTTEFKIQPEEYTLNMKVRVKQQQKKKKN